MEKTITIKTSKGNTLKIEISRQTSVCPVRYYADGDVFETDKKTVVHSDNVKFYVNGKLELSENNLPAFTGRAEFPAYFKSKGYPANIDCVMHICSKGICLEAGASAEIRAAVKELESHKTAEEIEVDDKIKKEKVEKEIKCAKETIAIAKGQKTIPTDAEARKTAEYYRQVINEGGDGYVPNPVTREQVERAEAILKNAGIAL